MDELYYRTLLKKYLNGTATDAERRQVDAWFAQANVVPPDDEAADARQERSERNWRALQGRINATTSGRRLPVAWYQVAAGLVLAIGLGWATVRWLGVAGGVPPGGVLPRSAAANGVATPVTAPIVFANDAPRKQARRYRLPDGSVAELQPGSRLTFAQTRAGRVVRLAGVATFAVRRTAPVQPFLVYGNGVVTRVLGTQFTVRAVPGRPTAEVSVHEGRVAVYRQPDTSPAPRVEPLILTPNERATYTAAGDRLEKGLVDNPVMLTTPQRPAPSFVFDDTPLTTVFAELERAYNVDIVFDATALRACTLTARLADQPLHTKLRMICASVGATYTVQGAQVVVTGGSCE